MPSYDWTASDVLSSEIYTCPEFIAKWAEYQEINSSAPSSEDLLTPPSSQPDGPPPCKRKKCETKYMKDVTDEAIELHKIGKCAHV